MVVTAPGVGVELSGGRPANVVKVCGCSSVVVSGEDVPPACPAEGSGVSGEGRGAGVYG